MSFSLELYKQPEIKESTVYGCIVHYKVVELSGRTLAKALIISSHYYFVAWIGVGGHSKKVALLQITFKVEMKIHFQRKIKT